LRACQLDGLDESDWIGRGLVYKTFVALLPPMIITSSAVLTFPSIASLFNAGLYPHGMIVNVEGARKTL
jgi:hypothetical protein